MDIRLNREQKFAYDALATNNSVYLCGSGGTGKSIVIKVYLDSLSMEERNKTMIVAPTGVAALNIGGVTIHRAFSAPIGPIGPDEELKEVAITKVRAAHRIIIDEISMCRFDLFSYVSRIIKRAEELEHRKIPLIVVGDFLQLPPVVKPNDVKVLHELWPNLKMELIKEGYPFLTEEWKQHHFINIRLTEVMRQSDQNFIMKLDTLRSDTSQEKSSVDWFNNNLKKLSNVEHDCQAIHLCARISDVEKINEEATNKFPIEKRYTFEACEEGDVTKCEKIVPECVELCVGMRVMSVVNDTYYKNGSLGTVREIGANYVKVGFDNGVTSVVEYYSWDILTYEVVKGENGKKILKKEVIGKYSQIPLKLAYAITIHKSQGQTFDQIILHPDCFAANQLYVGLSRCTSAEGIILSERIKKDSLIVSKIADRFYMKTKYTYSYEELNKPYHGGSREGAGRPKSNIGETRVMRVPEALVDSIKEMIEEYKNKNALFDDKIISN